jgi:hypothetical protein
MHHRLQHDPEKACPRLDPGWIPVSRLGGADQLLVFSLYASAGEGRPEKIMLNNKLKRNGDST